LSESVNYQSILRLARSSAISGIFSILGLVYIPTSSIYLILELFGLIFIIIVVFALVFILLEKKTLNFRNSKK
jgi:hypothetical protein